MNDKYVSKKPNGVAHCPICRGVLLRDFRGEKNSCSISFLTRCPHCQGSVKITIGGGEMSVQDAQ